MHKNKIWIGFLVVMTLIALWFVWGAAEELHEYLRHNKKTEPLSIEWSVYQQAKERYGHHAKFSYKTAEGVQSRETKIPANYRNPWTAKEALERAKDMKWDVWYDADHPGEATLYREFPTKRLLSTAVLVGLLLYFYWLGVYVVKFIPKDKP